MTHLTYLLAAKIFPVPTTYTGTNLMRDSLTAVSAPRHPVHSPYVGGEYSLTRSTISSKRVLSYLKGNGSKRVLSY